MSNLFKTKKKEVSSGTIKGIQALDGQYKKFDENIGPDSPGLKLVHETDNEVEHFTEVNGGKFVPLLVKEEDCSLPTNDTKSKVIRTGQSNPTNTFVKRQESVENTPNNNEDKNVAKNMILNPENCKTKEYDSCSQDEETLCKNCKMKVTNAGGRVFTDISTQCEDNIEDFQRELQPSCKGGGRSENREVKTDEQREKKASQTGNNGRVENIQGSAYDSTVSDMYAKFEQQKKEISDATAQNQALMSTLQEHTRLHRELELKVTNLQQEKESLLTRLSTIAGSRLRDGNPSITDLSDDNRPLNVAERFSELYDNEWSDAFEKLTVGRSEEETVQILLDLLQNIYTSCEIISEEQRHHLGQFGIYFNDEVDPTDVTAEQGQKSKEMQLMCGTVSAGRVQKKIKTDNEFQTKYGEYIDSCEIYIKASINICWMMKMQEVPMFLDFTCQREGPLNKDFYKEYTKSGKLCDYLVWPLLLLHKDGPVMQKGIVQPL